MFKMRVTNNKGQGIFAINSGTQELLAPELAKYPTPAPFQWLTEAEINDQGLLIPEGTETAIETIQVPVEKPSEIEGGKPTIEEQPFDVTVYKIYDYYVTVTDTHFEDSQTKKLSQRKENRVFLAALMDEFAVMNTESGITPAQNLAASEDPRMKKMQELVQRGDVETLVYFIEQTDWGALIPAQVKGVFLGKLTTYLQGQS